LTHATPKRPPFTSGAAFTGVKRQRVVRKVSVIW